MCDIRQGQKELFSVPRIKFNSLLMLLKSKETILEGTEQLFYYQELKKLLTLVWIKRNAYSLGWDMYG